MNVWIRCLKCKTNVRAKGTQTDKGIEIECPDCGNKQVLFTTVDEKELEQK